MTEKEEKVMMLKSIGNKLIKEMAWELETEMFRNAPRLVLRSWITRIERLVEESK